MLKGALDNFNWLTLGQLFTVGGINGPKWSLLDMIFQKISISAPSRQRPNPTPLCKNREWWPLDWIPKCVLPPLYAVVNCIPPPLPGQKPSCSGDSAKGFTENWDLARAVLRTSQVPNWIPGQGIPMTRVVERGPTRGFTREKSPSLPPQSPGSRAVPWMSQITKSNPLASLRNPWVVGARDSIDSCIVSELYSP